MTVRPLPLLPLLLVGISRPLSAQQVPDTLFAPPVAHAAYPEGQGPRVGIDEAHANFHTMDGGFRAFARLIARDGYRVEPVRSTFTDRSLAGLDILVIGNALGDTANVVVPTRSAFTKGEIGTIVHWVEQGGSLLLIADHMPFAGAAEALAHAFGVYFINGYALSTTRGAPSFMFRRDDGTLPPSPLADGRTPEERVDSVLTFGGQAFRARTRVQPVFVIPDNALVVMPHRWGALISDSTPRLLAGGLLQGATMKVGRGRVAFFGEAAMFTAQLVGPAELPMGMNAPEAAQNPTFVLNVLHWLGGLLDPDAGP